jgi:hypothetical protein
MSIPAFSPIDPIAPTDARAVALSLCRGWYQEAIVTGRARLSGADLKGKAGRFGGKYARSRARILGRLRAAGIPVSERKAAHGRRVLTICGVDADRIAVAS